MQNNDDASSDATGLRPAPLQLDPEKYQSELDAFDLIDDQKLKLLETLWSIMQSFVDRAFTEEGKEDVD